MRTIYRSSNTNNNNEKRANFLLWSARFTFSFLFFFVCDIQHTHTHTHSPTVNLINSPTTEEVLLLLKRDDACVATCPRRDKTGLKVRKEYFVCAPHQAARSSYSCCSSSRNVTSVCCCCSVLRSCVCVSVLYAVQNNSLATKSVVVYTERRNFPEVTKSLCLFTHAHTLVPFPKNNKSPKQSPVSSRLPHFKSASAPTDGEANPANKVRQRRASKTPMHPEISGPVRNESPTIFLSSSCSN